MVKPNNDSSGYATGRGFTVADLAKRYRVSEDKIRAWIRAGVLRGINTADVACGNPRFVVLPEALAEFEQVRSTAPPPKVPRRRRPNNQVDYFPGDE